MPKGGGGATIANSNVPATACTNTANCVSPATCFGNVCTMPAVSDFIERLSASSNFLSASGQGSFDNTWPTARVVPLETGPCDPMAEYNRIYGYRVSNTT